MLATLYDQTDPSSLYAILMVKVTYGQKAPVNPYEAQVILKKEDGAIVISVHAWQGKYMCTYIVKLYTSLIYS